MPETHHDIQLIYGAYTTLKFALYTAEQHNSVVSSMSFLRI